MKLWVGITDKNWFEYLMWLAPDEVNFWQPSGTRNCKVLQPEEPFLFKLHFPHNFIVGGGCFVRYSALPLSLAWDAFVQKNGVTSLSDFRRRVHRYRPNDDTLDPIIGCIEGTIRRDFLHAQPRQKVTLLARLQLPSGPQLRRTHRGCREFHKPRSA